MSSSDVTAQWCGSSVTWAACIHPTATLPFYFSRSSVNSFQFLPNLSVTVLLCEVVCISTTFMILNISSWYYGTFLYFSGRNVCLDPLFLLCMCACSCVFRLDTCRILYVWKTTLAAIPQESSLLFYEVGSLTSLELAEYEQQILGICLTSAGIASVCRCALPALLNINSWWWLGWSTLDPHAYEARTLLTEPP